MGFYSAKRLSWVSMFVICVQMDKVSSRKGVWHSPEKIVTREKLFKMNPLKESRFYPQELRKCLKLYFEKGSEKTNRD